MKAVTWLSASAILIISVIRIPALDNPIPSRPPISSLAAQPINLRHTDPRTAPPGVVPGGLKGSAGASSSDDIQSVLFGSTGGEPQR